MVGKEITKKKRVVRSYVRVMTVPTMTFACKVSPGLQDLQKQGQRILAERNAKKAEENTWIGWRIVAKSLGELEALVKSRGSMN